MILDDMETNPDKYRGKKLSDLVDDDDFDEESAVQYSKASYKNSVLQKMTLVSIILVVIFREEIIIVLLFMWGHTMVEYKGKVG